MKTLILSALIQAALLTPARLLADYTAANVQYTVMHRTVEVPAAFRGRGLGAAITNNIARQFGGSNIDVSLASDTGFIIMLENAGMVIVTCEDGSDALMVTIVVVMPVLDSTAVDMQVAAAGKAVLDLYENWEFE
jgi:hypothetical protein